MLKKRKECIAMLLAGGQGSRLKVLTEHTAKPAIPFGGKYRIIDFPLSNCVNSGIDTVGILTQYQPLELNKYIGNGQPWGLNRNFGGVHILPPYVRSKKSEWYKGTANAIYQNLHFIETYNPQYVLILSGDHVYKMNYDKMLRAHKERKADCTIAVIDVPKEEASRFGIMNTREDGSIYEFQEKPASPKSTTASMGIYIFNWAVLKSYLIADENNPNSSNDFGGDIIPELISDERAVFAYQFSGYWKDVGTIESLWEANMDLLSPSASLKLKDPDFKIYARNYAKMASFLSSAASIQNSMISEGCSIYGKVSNSIIYTGCTIEEGAEVSDSVIMPNTRVKNGAVVRYSIVGENTVIHEASKIGEEPYIYQQKGWNVSVVGSDTAVLPGTVILPAEVV